MKLEIENQAELTAWMKERMRSGVDVYSIKGPAPEGARYEHSDELITRPVNRAWQDQETGEMFHIRYVGDK